MKKEFNHLFKESN